MTDEELMLVAIGEAELAASSGDVPVGCVVVSREGAIVATGHNEREATGDPTAHAEMVALRRAAAATGHWRLVDATMVVTLEPCPMCAGALVNARVRRLVWGADDPKAGAIRTLYAIGVDGKLNHTLEVRAGVLADRCAELLRSFFARLRAG